MSEFRWDSAKAVKELSYRLSKSAKNWYRHCRRQMGQDDQKSIRKWLIEFHAQFCDASVGSAARNYYQAVQERGEKLQQWAWRLESMASLAGVGLST